MILGIMEDLEKLSDKFRKFVIENNSPVLMIGLFLGILFVFIIGWNMLHKGE